MPRPPDTQSKTSQIIVQANTPEEQKKIRALKEICKRNNLTIREEMFKKIDEWLHTHHWPKTDGHSQYQLSEFNNSNPRKKQTCQNCGLPPVKWGLKNGVWLGFCDLDWNPKGFKATRDTNPWRNNRRE